MHIAQEDIEEIYREKSNGSTGVIERRYREDTGSDAQGALEDIEETYREKIRERWHCTGR